jgi:hypothetical protein
MSSLYRMMFVTGENLGKLKERWKNLNNQILLGEEDQARIQNLLTLVEQKANAIQVPTREQILSLLNDMIDVSIIINELNEKNDPFEIEFEILS